MNVALDPFIKSAQYVWCVHAACFMMTLELPYEGELGIVALSVVHMQRGKHYDKRIGASSLLNGYVWYPKLKLCMY